MPAHDQLTALDASFLELEEADDGALMYIGTALVFDPLPAVRRRRSGRCAGGAEVVDSAGVDDVVQRLQRLLDRHAPVAALATGEEESQAAIGSRAR